MSLRTGAIGTLGFQAQADLTRGPKVLKHGMIMMMEVVVIIIVITINVITIITITINMSIDACSALCKQCKNCPITLFQRNQFKSDDRNVQKPPTQTRLKNDNLPHFPFLTFSLITKHKMFKNHQKSNK